ncbi:MAG: glutamine synthetase [Rhodospirillaceae bacterium]|jgi:glutamine synthetase|nr:glutamine synthetase [Rhodospirillaceae bacterium]MBT5244246.1 glutamine synthetase [Rhodospirillaceae bacterium]MBT5561771.1 glutamine synthetase [Rhodospirillaceae bacterium]MBT6243210.1 glutamine synthetase [Rhodospirillaceae bacterium]MBT7136882.1 glutamine synthetase [Rhodospirillaceae bacterium]
MDPRKVKTAADARKIVNKRKLDYVKVGVFDVDGIMRGKYMSKAKFFSALDGGFGFCDVVLGWDSKDQLYDNVTYTGWHTGYPDSPARIVPESCREIPWEDGMLLFIGEFSDKAEEICPRGVLRKVLKKADKMGFKIFSGMEFEFFVFEETPHSVREKNYRDMKPLTEGFFGYSMIRNSVQSDLYTDILETAKIMDFEIEGLHEETGAGCMEAAIGVSEGIASADKAALFKTMTKILCQKVDLMATFMAKWSPDWPGQSGHIHMSLQDKKGKSVFYDAKKPDNMSDKMRHFVGGQQQLTPELLAMIAPTVNSYTRLIPGFWAPTEASWGIDNRTCALRVIPGSAKSQRVEYRLAAADTNPYLALAASIGAGLWGIENKVEPSKPVDGNAYEQSFPQKLRLPATLYEAAARLKASKPARALFGDAFVDHFAATREWEEREFRKHITDWEMDRYFEII